MTDIAIQRIAQALGSLQHALLSPLGCCGGGGGRTATRVAGGGGGTTGGREGGSTGGGRRKKEESQLKYLILSGCHLITDAGLRWVWLCAVNSVHARSGLLAYPRSELLSM